MPVLLLASVSSAMEYMEYLRTGLGIPPQVDSFLSPATKTVVTVPAIMRLKRWSAEDSKISPLVPPPLTRLFPYQIGHLFIHLCLGSHPSPSSALHVSARPLAAVRH
jgi:hypothetical protein